MSTLSEKWAEAIADVRIRHLDPRATVTLELDANGDPPTLTMAVERAQNTVDPEHPWARLVISCVKLTYWPGLALARAWIASAWAGYMQHEALELVTIGGITERPLDPHAPPFTFDRGLRDGLPTSLTPGTLLRALSSVMDRDVATALVEELS